MGWIWVPGDQFSPAWVIWRTSNDYIGWARRRQTGHPHGLASEQFTKPEAWTFVAAAKFGKSCGAMPARCNTRRNRPPPPIVAPRRRFRRCFRIDVFVETVGYGDGSLFHPAPLFRRPFFDPIRGSTLVPAVVLLLSDRGRPALNFFANELNWLFAAINFGRRSGADPGPFLPGSPATCRAWSACPIPSKISPQQKHRCPRWWCRRLWSLPLLAPLVHAPRWSCCCLRPPPGPAGPWSARTAAGRQSCRIAPVAGRQRAAPDADHPSSRYRRTSHRRACRSRRTRPIVRRLRPLPATVTPHVPVNQFHGIVQTNTPRPVVRTYAPQAAVILPGAHGAGPGPAACGAAGAGPAARRRPAPGSGRSSARPRDQAALRRRLALFHRPRATPRRFPRGFPI